MMDAEMSSRRLNALHLLANVAEEKIYKDGVATEKVRATP